MLTRSEMEEILSRQSDESGIIMDEAFFAELSDDEVVALFEATYPEEVDRQELEKAIREWTD